MKFLTACSFHPSPTQELAVPLVYCAFLGFQILRALCCAHLLWVWVSQGVAAAAFQSSHICSGFASSFRETIWSWDLDSGKSVLKSFCCESLQAQYKGCEGAWRAQQGSSETQEQKSPLPTCIGSVW